mmetsp:Transcript_18172/g.37059  ORF Transcript_18172/g.37059 Transcript_18172/m.37059 type:complete len:1366 (-) Transcript_18172:58-4155(-)
MAMRAHVAKQVGHSSFRKKRSSPTHHRDKERAPQEQETYQTADEELEETTRFWNGVQECMDKAREGDATPKRERRVSARIKRRPSLQLTETLRGLKPKWVAVPQPVYDMLEKVPVINPNSGGKFRWDIMLGGLIFYSVIVIPLRVGFSIENNPDIELSDIIIDSIFGLDIIVSFDTAIIGDEDELITDRSLIARDYLTHWFVIDFLSTVPIDKMVSAFTKGGSESGSDVKLIRILRLARLMKLARVFKLGKFLKNVDMDAINPAAFGLCSLFFKILFTGHLLSCFWYFMTSTTVERDPHEIAWNEEFEIGGTLIVNSTLFEEYTASFYWTIATMMAVGYGDIYAMNSKERLYSIFAQLIGAISFGAMIATVNILVASSDPRARAYKSKMGELKAYLNERQVPKALGDEVKTAYKYYMAKKSVFGERELIENLPSSIRTQLVMAAYEVDVQKLTYLKNEDSAYVCFLMLSMRPFNCLPQDVLLEQNDIADEIIFLLRGTVHLIRRGEDIDEAACELVEDPDNFPFDETTPCLVGMVTEGGFFGDLGYRKKAPRVASYEAQNICQMLSVTRQEMDHANHMYSLSGKHFMKETQSRLEVFDNALKSSIIMLGSGRLSKNHIFVDGVLVDSSSIKVSASTGLIKQKTMVNMGKGKDEMYPKPKIGGSNSGPPDSTTSTTPNASGGIKRMASSELLNANMGGRRMSAPSLNLEDLDSSKHGVESPVRQGLNLKRSFKTRRSTVDLSGIGDLPFEEKDETTMDLLKRGIIEPNLPLKVKWDMFVGVLIVFSVITIPYRLGFDVPSTPQSTAQDIFVDTIFWMDIVVTFRCAYEDQEQDILITMPSDIAKNYFQTWFFIDFLSVFPIAEIVEFFLLKESNGAIATLNATDVSEGEASADAGELESLKLLKVVRLVRLMKLVRLLKLGSYLEKIEEEFSINPAAFELFKLLLQVTFIAHMFGCFWYFTSVQTTDPEDSWYWELDDTFTIEDKYIASLYWAFTTMTTVGYGDIPAKSTAEKWYSVVIMMLGATVFGYILANIATLMGQLNARDSRVNGHITSMVEYLEEKNIGKGLVKNIKTHIRFALSCTSVFDEYAIMQKLPTSLARKLFYHNHRETLRNICVFNHLKSTGVIMYVFNMLSPAQYADGHEIFAENSIPNDVYFVFNGKAEIVKTVKSAEGGDKRQITCGEVKQGQIIGYLGMLKASVHRHACIARGSLSVYYLHVHDLANVLYEHPFVAERLQVALGKCIVEQNEVFKKETMEARNKKFAEIMFAESNLLSTTKEVEDGLMLGTNDEEIENMAMGRASPQHVITPKLARLSSRSPPPDAAVMSGPPITLSSVMRGMSKGKIHPVEEGEDQKEEVKEKVVETS